MASRGAPSSVVHAGELTGDGRAAGPASAPPGGGRVPRGGRDAEVLGDLTGPAGVELEARQLEADRDEGGEAHARDRLELARAGVHGAIVPRRRRRRLSSD